MTWTYSGTPGIGTSSQRRDAVRLYVQDTDTNRQLLQDAEIAFFLSQSNNSLYAAAAQACRALSDPRKQNKSVGDLSIGAQGADYLTLAAKYEALAVAGAVPFAGGISIADKDAREDDTDRLVPAFTRNLQVTPALSSGS